MSWIADDNVVKDFDLEKLARSNEVTGDFDVGFGWCRFTARMIMRDNDCGGTGSGTLGPKWAYHSGRLSIANEGLSSKR